MNQPYLSFFWNTPADEREREQANADALMQAAIKGGMDPVAAKRAVEQVFMAGWDAGRCDENHAAETRDI